MISGSKIAITCIVVWEVSVGCDARKAFYMLTSSAEIKTSLTSVRCS
jgi:hypothetical protein